MTDNRRRFILAIGTALAAVTGSTAVARAQSGQRTQTGSRRARSTDSPHDAWMKRLHGHHRQFFHAFGATEIPGLMARNFLDAYTGPYGMRAEHVNAVVGVHGPAVAIVSNDTLWKKFGFGRRFTITDQSTGQPSERNIFASGSDISVTELQRHGVLFLVCDTALRLSAARWAPSVSQTAEATHAELRANLLPGVIPVPALVVAVNRAQEAGFTYIRAS